MTQQKQTHKCREQTDGGQREEWGLRAAGEGEDICIPMTDSC